MGLTEMDELKIWDIFVGKCVTMTFFFFNGKLTKFNSDCSGRRKNVFDFYHEWYRCDITWN